MRRQITIFGLLILMSGVAQAAAPATSLLLIDAERLADVRAPLKRGEDETKKLALAALEKDAAKALAMKPVSVMDKTIAPPSGDKHDYMSQAPYWWPDLRLLAEAARPAAAPRGRRLEGAEIRRARQADRKRQRTPRSVGAIDRRHDALSVGMERERGSGHAPASPTRGV